MRVLLLAAVLGFVIGCGKRDDSANSSDAVSADAGAPGPKPEVNAPREPSATLTAMDLWEQYGKNPLAADKKFKDKAVAVTGRGRIKSGATGGYDFGFEIIVPVPMTQSQLFSLPTREQMWWREGAYPPNVIAHLNRDAERTADDLRPGQQVRVIGVVKGSEKADVWRDYVVELDDCSLSIVEKGPQGK